MVNAMTISRRNFVTSAIASSLAVSLGQNSQAQAVQADSAKPAHTSSGRKPILICAHNGYDYIEDGYQLLKGGGDTLDAALRVVQGPENDPNDTSVGLGGLPNEDGVVELDSCCMHGPTRRAGSVGALHNVKNACLVAKAVMDHTAHVMLVGEGAEKFAVDEGFQRENLLTDKSRKIWVLYKETHSDWWGPGLSDANWRRRLQSGLNSQAELEKQKDEWQMRIERMKEVAGRIGIPKEEQMAAIRKVIFPPTGTIHCSALNGKGEISGCTTTSGLAWKIPGRVGDSAIIGAGCYTDQDVGSAGATGSGEENIKVAGAHTIVENMRHGMTPLEAGMDALKRIVRNYNGDMERIKFMDMTYYILRKDGAYAGVSLWTNVDKTQRHEFVVHDGERRREPTVALLEGVSMEWPPERTL